MADLARVLLHAFVKSRRGPSALLHRHFSLVLLAQLPLLGSVCALEFRPAQFGRTLTIGFLVLGSAIDEALKKP